MTPGRGLTVPAAPAMIKGKATNVRKPGLLLALASASWMAVGASAADIPQAVPLACIPSKGNARIVVPAAGAATSVRVYYHAVGREGDGDYYEEMRRGPAGDFWAMLPVPKKDTTAVSYRIQTLDADGHTLSSTPVQVPVTENCPPVVPTKDEEKFAANLVIGQTVDKQTTVPPGFECDGIVSKITVAGDLKSNDECRKPVAAWIAGGAALIAGGLVYSNNHGGQHHKPPVSQARP